MSRESKKLHEYGNFIADVVQTTQDTQTALNPKYETIKKHIDDGTLKDMPANEYLEIQGEFQSGVDTYKKTAKEVAETAMDAPAKLVGTHRSLAKAYANYAESCQLMLDSMKDNRDVDKDKFEESEKAQDEYAELMSKYLQKIINSLS